MAYNLRNIRALLNEGFTGDELRRMCYDSPTLRPVYNSLPDTDKAEIIDRLIELAERRRLIPELLNLAQAANPIVYEEKQPYVGPDPVPVPPAPSQVQTTSQQNFGFNAITGWIEKFGIWITALSLVLAAILGPLGLDNKLHRLPF